MNTQSDDVFETPSKEEHVTVQERVYRQLRRAIVRGQLIPGRTVTLRGLAEMLGVSPMPVRDAVRRLVAERALQKLSNRRVTVPTMTAEKFNEICRARLVLEPEAAAHALPGIDQPRLALLVAIDDDCTRAMTNGDTQYYMQKNQEFHFALYESVPQPVFMPMIESLWLQFGPFMRSVARHWETSRVLDQHHQAIKAIQNKDSAALEAAIRADILDGMRIIGRETLETP